MGKCRQVSTVSMPCKVPGTPVNWCSQGTQCLTQGNSTTPYCAYPAYNAQPCSTNTGGPVVCVGTGATCPLDPNSPLKYGICTGAQNQTTAWWYREYYF